MLPPFRYYGGKHFLVKHLLKYIPPHRVYVEVFGGAANLLLAKPPSEIEVYNDIDSALVNFFRVLRDTEKFTMLLHALLFTPYSRAEHDFCVKSHDDENVSDVEQARRFFVAIEQSFDGVFAASWSFSIERSLAKSFFNRILRLYEIAARFRFVYIENDDFEKVIRRYDSVETFFYLDPPYLTEASDKKGYRYSMSEEDHERLVNALLYIKGKALLSGYPHAIYRPLEEAGWRRVRVTRPVWARRVRGGRKRGRRSECLWMNYQL